jgi:hypothetical protein
VKLRVAKVIVIPHTIPAKTSEIKNCKVKNPDINEITAAVLIRIIRILEWNRLCCVRKHSTQTEAQKAAAG